MALLLYSILFLAAVIGRMAWQYKSTGDTGIRWLRRDAPWINKLACGLLLLAVVLTLSAALMELNGKLDIWYEFTAPLNYLLFMGGLAAIVFINYSQYQMGRSWRIGVDESEQLALVTHGVYASIRNPIYTGLFAFLLVLMLLAPSLLMVTGVLLAWLAIELQVRYVEEPYLLHTHGELFENYQAQVNRYVPWG